MMKANKIFTPGRFPEHTFVDDHLVEKRQQLIQTLDAGSMLVSISGPSKSGKTVFVEQILGPEALIQVTGSGVQEPDDLWARVFDIIGTPIQRTVESHASVTGQISGKVSATGTIWVAKGSAEGGASAGVEKGGSTIEVIPIDPLQLLIKELGGTDLVIFVDDFHYIPRAVQIELAEQIKEAIRNDVRFICAAVPYHSDDVIRGNPDLRGRVFSIDFDYWDSEILKKIAYKGFSELNVIWREPMIDKMALEAAGSPQLMQYLCLNACYELNVLERPENPVDFEDDGDLLVKICRRTVQSTDYSTTVERVKDGPKTRGSSRKEYRTPKGWQGDVYRFLLIALALDPPQLTFRYQDLVNRFEAAIDGELPSGSSITGACDHSASIANDSVGANIVEWDSEADVFDIRDPYFLFYLRWCGTLQA